MANNQSPGYEMLDDMFYGVIDHAVSNSGLTPDKATDLAKTLIDYIHLHWGGQLLYIPKHGYVRPNTKKQEIASKFNGTNHRELAREFNLSVVTIYKYLKEAKKQNQE